MSVIYLYSAQTLERYVLLVRLASEKTAKESTELRQRNRLSWRQRHIET
jgi:hypothetical protein